MRADGASSGAGPIEVISLYHMRVHLWFEEGLLLYQDKDIPVASSTEPAPGVRPDV
jgi:hypothetical protein